MFRDGPVDGIFVFVRDIKLHIKGSPRIHSDHIRALNDIKVTSMCILAVFGYLTDVLA